MPHRLLDISTAINILFLQTDYELGAKKGSRKKYSEDPLLLCAEIKKINSTSN